MAYMPQGSKCLNIFSEYSDYSLWRLNHLDLGSWGTAPQIEAMENPKPIPASGFASLNCPLYPHSVRVGLGAVLHRI